MAKTRGYKRHHQVQVIQDDIFGVMLAAISAELISIILIFFVLLQAFLDTVLLSQKYRNKAL